MKLIKEGFFKKIVLRQSIFPALLLACLLFFGCATSARIDQFKQFAVAGNTYSEAMTELTTAAGDALVNADSVELIKVREAYGPEKRGSLILKHDQDLKDILSLLRDLRLHMQMLSSYFQGLAALAESNAPSGIGTAAEGLVDSLGTVSKRIKEAKVGEMPVNKFIGAAVPMVVAQFQRAALENELRVRAPIMEQELDLQQAAWQAISHRMKADLEAYINWQISTAVVQPYILNPNPLTLDWANRRRELLTGNLSLASAEAAAHAATSLKLAFVALVENRIDAASIKDMMKEITEILTLIETVHPPKKKAERSS